MTYMIDLYIQNLPYYALTTASLQNFIVILIKLLTIMYQVTKIQGGYM